MSLTPGLQLPFGVQPVNPVPVDSWSGPYSGSDETTAKAAANAAVTPAIRFQSMEVRLVYGGSAHKFWYKDGILDTDLVEFASGSSGAYVPYTGATQDVDLGVYDITAAHLIKDGGQPEQFLKADGSVDNNIYLTSADLPSTLDLFATTSISDVSGYTVLVRNISDPRYNTTAVNVPIGPITVADVLVGSLISDNNIISGNPGVFDITTVGNIRRTTGTGQAEFYFRIYKRDSSGTETFITQSNVTLPVLNGGYAQFSAVALWNDGVFTETDRVVIKYYASRIVTSPVGSDPSFEFQFGGITPVRSVAPVPSAVIPNIYLKDLADVENVAPLNNEILYWNSSTSLWEHTSVDGLIGYTPVAPTRSISTTSPLLGGGDLSANRTLSIQQSSNTLSGFLSSSDWITFNGKQNAITNPVTGLGTINELSYWTSASSIGALPVATYPSLTEIAYVKGVTSAIQTQLNGKQATLTNPITGIGTTNRFPKFTGASALGDSLVIDNGTTVTIEGLLSVTKSISASYATTSFINLASNGYVQHQFEVGANVANIQYAPTFAFRFTTNEANTPIIFAPNSTTALTILPSGVSTFASTLQATRIGLGATPNVASYLNTSVNTASVGQLLLPKSAVDYTGPLAGMIWNNAMEFKFYDDVLATVNRFLKLNGNTALANSNPLNVVTSTGTGGNLGTLKAEVAFSRFPIGAINYTILLTDIGFGWIIACTTVRTIETITLPAANTVPAGFRFHIYDETGSVSQIITINSNSGTTIGSSGATTSSATGANAKYHLYSDGVSKWFML